MCRYASQATQKQTWVSFVVIGNLGNNDCLVGVYLLRYKDSVYIAILLVGTSKCVCNSRKFEITVFNLTIFSDLYIKEILPGIPNYLL